MSLFPSPKLSSGPLLSATNCSTFPTTVSSSTLRYRHWIAHCLACRCKSHSSLLILSPLFTATRQSSPALEKLVPRLFPSFPANLTTSDPSTARASFSPVSSHPEKPKASFPSLVGPRPASPSLSLGQNCYGLSLRSLFLAVSVIVAAIALSGVLRLRRRESHCTVPWSFGQVLWPEPSCAAKTKSATISPPLPAF